MNSSLKTLHELDNNEIAISIECSINDLHKYFHVKKTQLNIISQNIRSIYANFIDFEITLSQFKCNIDVIILTECRLKPDKPVPYLPNYTSYLTTNLLNQNDGVVAYIRNDHQVIVKEITLSHASCLQINISNNLILGIYRSPSNTNAEAFINSINLYLDSIKTTSNIIITGDININLIHKDHQQTYERNNRQLYLSSLVIHGILPGHSAPTREFACLDHFMLKLDKRRNSAFIAILQTSITDHCMIFLNLSTLSTNTFKITKTKTVVNYDNALLSLQGKNLQELTILSDPNEFSDMLIDRIVSSLVEHTKILSIARNKRIIKPYITEGILRCIYNRNNLQKKLKSDPNNAILKITFRRYRNYCNGLIKKVKRKYEREKLNQAQRTKSSKHLWKAVNEITQFKQSKTSNNNLLYSSPTPSISVNNVNNYFAGIGQTLASQILSTSSHHDVLPPIPSSSIVSSMVLLDTDPKEVEWVLMSLDSDSATGYDNISTIFLKKCKFILVPVMVQLVNLCFSTGIFPKTLKKSIVTPVYKNGDRIDASNYRPISVLSSISKILEKLINSRLMNYLDKYKILSDTQFGFRKKISTEDAVTSLTSLLIKNLDTGKKCLAAFLDLKKAFDTVSIPILVRKLEHLGIRGTTLALFHSYLTERTQRVKIGQYISDDVNVTFGVPQGSVLGPTLFLVYINDLCKQELPFGKIFSYADDTAIVFVGNNWEQARVNAEAGLAGIAQWLNMNLLTLNTQKTNYICFSIRDLSQPADDFNIRIHDCFNPNSSDCYCPSIARVDKTKYLGVMLDQNLSWYPHLNLVSCRIRKIIWIFKILRHAATNNDIINKIYIALAQSLLIYCIPIWGGSSKTKFLELERAQRSLLKVMYFKPYRFPTYDLYRLSDILTVRMLYIFHTVIKFHKSLIYDPNVLKKRRKDLVVPIPTIKTSFAAKQYNRRASHLYNTINRKLNIYAFNSYDCKTKIKTWLSTLNYQEIESLLEVII